MVEIRPIQGIHYNPEKIHNFSDVVCPPYDIISPSKHNQLYQAHEHNFVRIDFNRKGPNDQNGDAVYSRAKSFFQEWMDQAILVQDKTPCIYIYQQDFEVPATHTKRSRTSFIAGLRLQSFDQGNVRPHEYTFSGPKKDRLELMRNVGAVTGQIFVIYPDPDHQVTKLLTSQMKAPAFITAQSDDIQHTLWRVNDKDWIKNICAAMSDKWLLIADGHHRYETALTYQAEASSKASQPDPEAPYHCVMMTFAAMEDPGLEILPIHRLVKDRNRTGWDAIRSGLEKHFQLEKAKETEVADALHQLSEKGKDSCAFWMKPKGSEPFWVRRSDRQSSNTVADQSHSTQWNQLDVAVFQTFVLKQVFGFSDMDIQNREGIECPKDPLDALEVLECQDEYDYLFLLNPVKMKILRTIVEGGERMPQKSTNFHPKVYSGFVVQKF